MIHSIYLDIESKLNDINTALADAGLPTIKTIAPWNDQYNFMREELAIDFPAVLVQFVRNQWQMQSQQVQRGEMIIRLHIVMRRHSEGFRGSRDQGNYLEIYHLPAVIYAGMQGLSGNNFKQLTRIAEAPVMAHDAVAVFTQDYRCLAEDSSASLLKSFIENSGTGEVDVQVDWSLI